MDRDAIAELGFDEQGRLYVKPLSVSFPYIDRATSEISWDDACQALCAPPPPRANGAPAVWWLGQILAVARAQDCALVATAETKFINVPYTLTDALCASLPT